MQVHKHFTIDDYSHYVFTPRDLTSWVLGLMRYPLAQSADSAAGMGGGAHSSPRVLLEMWAYEACRLFRDRLVGTKSQEKFDSILNAVVRSDWSVDLSSSEQEGKPLYVSWGASSAQQGGGGRDSFGANFGCPLGRLAGADMQETVAKGVVAYGKSFP